MARRDPLAGPAMGYGVQPRPAGKGGIPTSTLVLAVLCVVLAIALGLALAGRRSSGGGATDSATAAASTPAAVDTATPTPDASPGAEEPAGAREAATTFLRACRTKNPDVRAPLLSAVATDAVAAKLSETGPTKIVTAAPAGAPVIRQTGELAASAEQRLTDRSVVRLQLVFDPTAQYGWVVDSATRKS